MKFMQVSLASVALSVLAGCGGGGDSGNGTGSPSSGVISGTVTKGPMSNASVVAYAINAGQLGAQIATATTDASGKFTIATGSYAGAVMLRASGGNYTDEATGMPMSMAPGDVMTAVMPSIAAGTASSNIQVTPVTAMAQAMASDMAGGMTDANIEAANSALGSYFSVADILHTQPMNPLVPGSGAGASQDMRNYGMTLAAVSQYAKGLNMANSSSMVTAMMDDAADGTMDGMHGANRISMPMQMGGMMGGGTMAPTAGTSSLAAAMSGFMISPANASGVTPAEMASLVQKLGHSNGRI